jgi:uncharacterized membrane protein
MPLWLIPMVYTVASVGAGLVMPRLEHTYFPEYTHGMSVSAAIAFFSAVSSGMLALTAIVFAIAFVVVQFSAVAYSPRLVVEFSSSPTMFHSLGVFFATFAYSLVALAWTDRGGSGTVPLFSTMLVGVLLIISMVAFARLIQSLNGLQLHNVLEVIGARGRSAIDAMFPEMAQSAFAGSPATEISAAQISSATQTLTYNGNPRVINGFDFAALVRLAEHADALVAIEWGVGETLMEHAVLLRVHGTKHKLPQQYLMRAIHLSTARHFEQDPKYAIRLLVDIAIRALSPAVNDPTTAVQALDQIEGLLRRLGRRQLDPGYLKGASGAVRVTFPVPSWQDYLDLAFDEIRQFGLTSVQVNRRLKAALIGLADTIEIEDRRIAVRRYLDHVEQGIERSTFDDIDQTAALQQDRQGLGLTRHHQQSGRPG